MSSLANALDVLGLLRQDQPVLRVGEVCRQVGLPKSSVSRLLQAMSRSALLERDAGGKGYVAGPLAVRLADLYLARHSLLALMDAALARLIGAFGFTGFAASLSGAEIVLLRVVQGSYPLRHVREIGARLPAARTVMGRALLARLPDAKAPGRRARVLVAPSALTPGITTIGGALLRAGENPLALALAFPDQAAGAALRAAMIAAVRRECADIGRQIQDPQWTERDDC
jgi:DNA-binding IclR family transcriptional regulator